MDDYDFDNDQPFSDEEEGGFKRQAVDGERPAFNPGVHISSEGACPGGCVELLMGYLGENLKRLEHTYKVHMHFDMGKRLFNG